jgi:hypothetical protein
MIPMILLDKTIELLDGWEFWEYDPDTRFDYCNVLWALKLKKYGPEPKPSFTKLVEDAMSDQAREEARQQFLDQKMIDDQDYFDDDVPF